MEPNDDGGQERMERARALARVCQPHQRRRHQNVDRARARGMGGRQPRDLRRIAGGRLSDEPKDRRLWVRSEFSSEFSPVVAGPASDEATVTGTVTHETAEDDEKTGERGATTTENPVAVGESRRGPREEGALGRVKASSSTALLLDSDSALPAGARKDPIVPETSRSSRPATRSSPNASPKRLVPSLSRKGQHTRGADADSSLGGFIQDFLGPLADQTSAPAFNPKALGLPESFDARTKWSQCAHLIGVARDQGNCGSCWAMAPAEVMSDRACIQSDGKVNAELSPFQLLACAQGSFGCEGGESADAYEFAKSNGVVTGGGFDDKTRARRTPSRRVTTRARCSRRPRARRRASGVRTTGFRMAKRRSR